MSDAGNSSAVKGCLLLVFLGGVFGIVALAGVFLFTTTGGGGSVARPVASPGPSGVVSAEGQAPTGAAVKRIRDRGTLRVGMDTGEPPFTGTPPMYFPNASGEPDGFDVALAKQIQAAVGARDLKVVHAKYSGLEDLLVEPDQIDLVISGYSPDDTAGIAWSSPYLEYGLCLIVPTKSKVKTTADLFGHKIGIFDDDAAADDVQKLVRGYTEMVRLEDGYWDQLANGRFDAFFYDYPYTAAELNLWYKANPSRKGSLRIAQYNLTDSDYAVGVRTADADLLAVVNHTIEKWRASPEYGDAIQTYLKGGLAVEPPKGAKVHVVRGGETLSLIAKAELGAVDRWPALWELNKDRFPNPHLIDIGDEVVLP